MTWMALGLLALTCGSAQALWAAALPNAGQTAPALVASVRNGTEFDLAAHKGQVVILHFWANLVSGLPARDAPY